MKSGWKMGVCILAAMLMLGVTTMVQAETQLKQLGQNPFYGTEMKSVADFQQMVKKTLPDLKKGFEMAGAADLFDEFVNQTNQSNIKTVEVKPGEKLQWMVFKKGKTVKIIRDVVWAGKKPFKAFQVTVDKSGKRYTFITAATCGNTSLAQITPLPPAPSAQAPVPPKTPVSPPPAPVNKAPLCQVAITPVKVMSGKDITIDASQSQDPDGSIASVKIRVLDANNQMVSEKILTQPPFIHQMVMPQTGNYTVRVSVKDDKGLESSAPGCNDQEIVVASCPGHLLADFGVMYQGDPATYLLFRLGYDYRLRDNFSILGMIGFAPVVHGDDDTNSGLVDLTGIYHYKRMYLGAGVGFWYSSDDERVDFILNAGYRIFGERDQRNISLFIEGRSAFDEFDDLDKYGRIGAGLRFQF